MFISPALQRGESAIHNPEFHRDGAGPTCALWKSCQVPQLKKVRNPFPINIKNFRQIVNN